MTIEEVKAIIQNKVVFLEQQKNSYQANGDLTTYEAIEKEIAETKATLEKLG
jgi:hypothetical protein